MTRDKILLKKESLDLRELIARAVSSCRLFIDSRRHDLVLSLPKERVWIEGDALRLEQILVNLLNNAAKYTDIGGRIWLTVDRQWQGDASWVLVRLRDTGMEMALSMKPDVALVDIGLPGLDGYQIAERLRAMKAGFDAHLVKPVDPDRLMAVLTVRQASASPLSRQNRDRRSSAAEGGE